MRGLRARWRPLPDDWLALVPELVTPAMCPSARGRLVHRRGHYRRLARTTSSNGSKPFKTRERACDLYAGLYRWMGNTCPRCGAAELPLPHRRGMVAHIHGDTDTGLQRHSGMARQSAHNRDNEMRPCIRGRTPAIPRGLAMEHCVGLEPCETTALRNRPAPLPAANP